MRNLDVPGIRRRLGANVRRLRLAAKLTQIEASERAGLDVRHCQRAETADTNPTASGAGTVKVCGCMKKRISRTERRSIRCVPGRRADRPEVMSRLKPLGGPKSDAD